MTKIYVTRKRWLILLEYERIFEVCGLLQINGLVKEKLSS